MDIRFNKSANQNAPISFFAQVLKYLLEDWILEEDKRPSPRCNARKFTLWDQIVSLLFCHLVGCDWLREIHFCCRQASTSLSQSHGPYNFGLRQ